jgi:hypothetical protein
VLQILFIVYFVGQYWFVLVQTGASSFIPSDSQSNNQEDLSELQNYKSSTSFLHYDSWDFTEYDGRQQTIVSMYFALTSLSTVGFGDFYPVTDFERLICSMLLLSGVLIMSYVLSELRFMITNIDHLSGKFDFNDELE